jgi:tetratricopeptide (TPR) repeat protein
MLQLDSRGLTYLKMGQFDSAIEDYSSALRIEPKMASVRQASQTVPLRSPRNGASCNLASVPTKAPLQRAALIRASVRRPRADFCRSSILDGTARIGFAWDGSIAQ